eukprot:scaffold14241_cov109-Isochrysis_galbana.AAC.2
MSSSARTRTSPRAETAGIAPYSCGAAACPSAHRAAVAAAPHTFSGPRWPPRASAMPSDSFLAMPSLVTAEPQKRYTTPVTKPCQPSVPHRITERNHALTRPACVSMRWPLAANTVKSVVVTAKASGRRPGHGSSPAGRIGTGTNGTIMDGVLARRSACTVGRRPCTTLANGTARVGTAAVSLGAGATTAAENAAVPPAKSVMRTAAMRIPDEFLAGQPLILEDLFCFTLQI